MSTEELLAILKDRGLTVTVREDGTPVLKGNGAKTEKLLRVLKQEPHRSTLLRMFGPRHTRRILLVEDGRETVLREFAPGPEWEVFEEERTKHPGKLLWMQAWRNVFGDEKWVTFARTGD